MHSNDFIYTTQVLAAATSGGDGVVLGSFVAPFDMQIIGAMAYFGTAPDDADALVDIHVGGSTVFIDQDNRVKVVQDTQVSAFTRPDALETVQQEGYNPTFVSGGLVSAGELVEVYFDLGATAGADLIVTLHCKKV